MKNRKPFTLNGRTFSFEVIPHNNQGRPPSYWVRDAAGNDVGLLHRQHLRHLAWDKYTFALSLDFQISATKLPYCATSLRMMNGTLPEKGAVLEVPPGIEGERQPKSIPESPFNSEAQMQARANGTAFKPGVVNPVDYLDTPRPRKIPHVRMVRAAALQPGMEILGHVHRGVVCIKFEVLEVKPMGMGFYIETMKLERRRDDGTHTAWGAKRHIVFTAADQVLPVFVEWRDKVAL